MPEKLLTLKELSDHLNISEDEIRKLVDMGVIPAYSIGGSFLRFRKEQMDIIRNEILAKKIPVISTKQFIPKTKNMKNEEPEEVRERFGEKILDFVYFNDFYIISLACIAFLLYIILKL